MKILVVDDEESKRVLYRSEFEEAGYEVVTAENEEEAMELFKRETPDLVTLDVVMPSYQEKEGIRALRLMKDINPGIPIIILTAFDFTSDMQIWAADGYIVKSSDITELKDKIKELTGSP